MLLCDWSEGGHNFHPDSLAWYLSDGKQLGRVGVVQGQDVGVPGAIEENFSFQCSYALVVRCGRVSGIKPI